MTVIGGCSKHPGFSWLSCPRCAAERSLDKQNKLKSVYSLMPITFEQDNLKCYSYKYLPKQVPLEILSNSWCTIIHGRSLNAMILEKGGMTILEIAGNIKHLNYKEMMNMPRNKAIEIIINKIYEYNHDQQKLQT